MDHPSQIVSIHFAEKNFDKYIKLKELNKLS